MGTERDKVYEGPCLCGNGTFTVDYCNPDHGWPTSTPFWHEYSINCKDCLKKYELIEQGHFIVIVEKLQIAKQQGLTNQWHEHHKALMASPNVKKILASFSCLLNSLGSIAAIFRFLSVARLEDQSLGTFRKKWTGAENWVNRNVSPHDLATVQTLLNLHDEYVNSEVEKLNDLWEATKEQLQYVGEPIYKIRD